MSSTFLRPRCISDLTAVEEISARDFPVRIEPGSILMCDPLNFEVKDAKNAFMEGNVGAVDIGEAQTQWALLKTQYERLGYVVHVLPSLPGLEDMVFTANQVLPGLDENGTPYVVLAEMKHPSRRDEVPHFGKWFARQGYRTVTLPCSADLSAPRFEGQGDAIWHPSRHLLWIGYGNRTDVEVCGLLSELLSVTVLQLRLATDRFYHLDTAFAALDVDHVLIYPPAFDEQGLNLIRHFFKTVIEVSADDAANFACNAVVLGRHVVLQKGSSQTCEQLRQCGFTPIEVETSEFMKSGGSAFCLKMMVY